MLSVRIAQACFVLLAAVVSFLTVPTAAWAIEEADDRGAIAIEQCVLLKNGSVLTGVVSRDEDGYTIERKGATLHLAFHQVDAICEDLHAAYAHRRESVETHDATGHLKLADWCLMQGLVDHATGEVEVARRMEPTHPRLPVVQRRLAVAREPARLAPSPAYEEPSQNVPKGNVDRHPLAQRAADAPTAREPLADYPEDTMEQFRRGIQPLLLNSCTSSGCHNGGGEYSFVLDRRALWNDAPRELTYANLSAVLDRLNREAPLESRLLAAATTPHARSLAAPPLAVESAGFSRLTEWVLHVTGHDTPKVAPADAPPSPDENAEEVRGDEISDEELDSLLTNTPDERLAARQAVQRGLRAAARRPDDPYDPDEFNRRHAAPKR